MARNLGRSGISRGGEQEERIERENVGRRQSPVTKVFISCFLYGVKGGVIALAATSFGFLSAGSSDHCVRIWAWNYQVIIEMSIEINGECCSYSLQPKDSQPKSK